MSKKVLLIGNRQAPEFSTTLNWLETNLDLTLVPEPSEVPPSLDEFGLILLAMSVRHQFHINDANRLRQLAPLARICVIVGSWCEGETRSGAAWPGVERIYTHQVVPRAISEDWANSFACPIPTRSAEEQWIDRAKDAKPETDPHDSCVVCSEDTELRASLVAMGRHFGLQMISVDSHAIVESTDVSAVVYDADRNRKKRVETLERLTKSFPKARIIGLLEYPRHDEIAEILQSGGSQVVGKPFDIVDLMTVIASSNP